MPAILYPLLLLVVAVIFLWLIFWLLGQFPLPDPIGKIVQAIAVILVVIVLVWVLLSIFGVGPPLRVGWLALRLIA